MLNIENLHASAGNKEILKGISVSINAGESHAMMGPNRSGKSTRSHFLAGRPGNEVTGGSVTFQIPFVSSEVETPPTTAPRFSTSLETNGEERIVLLALTPHNHAAS